MDNIEKLNHFDNDKLQDIVRNYRQYGYDDALRNAAISVLESRGITREDMVIMGNFENHEYDLAIDLYKSFDRSSKIAFVLYIMYVGVWLASKAMLYKSDNQDTAIFVLLYIVLFIGFSVFLIRSFMIQNQIYGLIKKDRSIEGALVFLVVGMPFYIFTYFYFRSQMKELMREIR